MKMKYERIFRIAISATMLLGLGGTVPSRAKTPGGATQSQTASVEVKIDNFNFAPAELTVAAGTRVTWTNRDDVPHTVASTNDLFKSKALDTDDQFSFTFDKAGTYEYYCSIHPKMIGKVIVK
jgi:plastocyanin